MMRRIRLLQIGDVHYPDWQPFASEVDAKDTRFTPDITDHLRGSSFRAVLRKLGQLAASDTIHGVVFVGDFTTRGKSEYLEGAFRHFSLLCRAKGGNTRGVPLMFVPGNHDVNRDDALNLGSVEKFRKISQMAEAHGWLPIPLNQPVSARIEGIGGGAEITLLNTALGSWALQNLPQFLQDKLTTADLSTEPEDLGAAVAGDDGPAAPMSPVPKRRPGNLVDQYYGQLDTPYVSTLMLSGLMEKLQGTVAYGLLVGHHNLLPQKTPRISPYAEMLNAGFVRHQLLSLGKPVVYMHGHIHQDPVEVVSDPRVPGSQLVLISAPEIKDGFNEIVLFITESDELAGVRLIPHRTRLQDGTLSEDAHCFISTLSHAGAALDETTFTLFKELKRYCAKRGKDLLYWREVQEVATAGMSADALEDALLMLQGSHSVDIDGLSKSHRDWRIQIKGK